MSLYECPLPTALTPIPATACPFRIDQIVALGIARASAGLITGFTPTSGISTLTSSIITTAMADTDDGKLVLTPAFGGFAIAASEANIEGENDGATPFGAGIVNQSNTVVATGMFHDKSIAAIDAMRKLIAENAGRRMQFFFINRDGEVFLKNTGLGVYGFNFFIGSRGTAYNTSDKNNFRITLPPDWDKGLQKATTDFDILTLLPL